MSDDKIPEAESGVGGVGELLKLVRQKRSKRAADLLAGIPVDTKRHSDATDEYKSSDFLRKVKRSVHSRRSSLDWPRAAPTRRRATVGGEHCSDEGYGVDDSTQSTAVPNLAELRRAWRDRVSSQGHEIQSTTRNVKGRLSQRLRRIVEDKNFEEILDRRDVVSILKCCGFSDCNSFESLSLHQFLTLLHDLQGDIPQSQIAIQKNTGNVEKNTGNTENEQPCTPPEMPLPECRKATPLPAQLPVDRHTPALQSVSRRTPGPLASISPRTIGLRRKFHNSIPSVHHREDAVRHKLRSSILVRFEASNVYCFAGSAIVVGEMTTALEALERFKELGSVRNLEEGTMEQSRCCRVLMENERWSAIRRQLVGSESSQPPDDTLSFMVALLRPVVSNPSDRSCGKASASSLAAVRRIPLIVASLIIPIVG